MLKAGHNITWKTNIVLEYFWTILTRTNGICLTLGMDKSFGKWKNREWWPGQSTQITTL